MNERTYFHYVNHEKRKTWTQLYARTNTDGIEQVTMEQQAKLRLEGYRFIFYGALHD